MSNIITSAANEVELVLYYDEEDNLVAELSSDFGVEMVSNTIISFN